MPVDPSLRPLHKVVELITDRAVSGKDSSLPYIGLEHIAQGQPILVGIGSTADFTSANTVFHSSDILFGKLRPNLRKSLRVDFDGYCSTDILVFRTKEHEADPGYLQHIFQSEMIFEHAVKTAEGTKMPRTSWGALRDLQIFLPTLGEQRRIAEILDTLDDAIAQTETLIAKLRQIKAGLIHDLLTRGLDEHGQLRDPVAHPEQFKGTAVGRVPREWKVTPLSSVCARIGDGAHASFDKSGGEIPFLFVSCIRDGQIHWENASGITYQTYRFISKGREPCKGMVLYTVVGSYGHAALVDADKLFGFQRHIAYFIPDESCLAAQYLAEWLNSPTAKSLADGLALGNAQKTITLNALNTFPIAIPSLDEQTAITNLLSSHSTHLHTEEAYCDKLKQMKQGLMADLLTGRVRT